MTRPVFYVAGPYSAPSAWKIELNVRAAERASLYLCRLGAAVICPHTMSRYFFGTMPEESWRGIDEALVKKADALFMLEYWEDSKGALAEHALAIACGIPIFYESDVGLTTGLSFFIKDWSERQDARDG